MEEEIRVMIVVDVVVRSENVVRTEEDSKGAEIEDITAVEVAKGAEEATDVDAVAGALGGARVMVLGTAVMMAGF